MVDFLNKIKENAPGLEKAKSFFCRRAVWLPMAIFLFLLLLFFGAAYGYVWAYQDRIYPGVRLGEHPLGGLDATAAGDFLRQLEKRQREEGINYVFNIDGEEKKIKIDTTVTYSDAVVELVDADGEKLIATALAVGRDVGFWSRLWQPVAVRFRGRILRMPVTLAHDRLLALLKEKLSVWEILPNDALVQATGFDPVTYTVAPEIDGQIFDYEEILRQTEMMITEMNLRPLVIAREAARPAITRADLDDSVADNLLAVYDFGGISLMYRDELSGEEEKWSIIRDTLLGWLVPARGVNGEIYLAPDPEKFSTYLQNYITPEIDRSAENPKFSMSGGRVTELKGGKSGREVDLAATYATVEDLYEKIKNYDSAVTNTVAIVVQEIFPDEKLSEINDLGITEILGVGISHFKNSHTNRIKNIANAVRVLNGTIVAPGEEFSTNVSAGPFTLANGYLAEDVIKGDQIVKEIGGGMCQIGTTLFRMAMNAGMIITERRNHSLVVSYYADPVNGNPGTDATVYEPILDLKFLNDTGHYLLVETEMDTVKEELRFTLWGTPDGRSGSYTHPIVERWLPAGPARTIESAKMAPGEKRCQGAFPGAIASFVYTRMTPDGEKIEQVFNSTYRALPATCWVGVDTAVASSTPAGASTECVGDNCAPENLPSAVDEGIIESDAVASSTVN